LDAARLSSENIERLDLQHLPYADVTGDSRNQHDYAKRQSKTPEGGNGRVELMTIISFIVGLSISGQTFYTFILENLDKFGALKAIVAKGRELVCDLYCTEGLWTRDRSRDAGDFDCQNPAAQLFGRQRFDSVRPSRVAADPASPHSIYFGN
jgi:hypothetical protein